MILMYHNIDDVAAFNTVSMKNLSQQLKFVKANFDIVDMDTYLKTINKSNSNNVVISVDDAYVSFENFFVPLLEQLNIPVILFVPVNHIAKYNIWDEGKKRIEILSREKIKLISQNKFVTIGSHGLTHSRLSKLEDEDIKNEIVKSKYELEKLIAGEIKHFSYPFGQMNDYNKLAIETLKKSGYKSACSTRFRNNNYNNNLYNLFRVEVEPSDNMELFKKKCNNHYHFKYFKRLIKENMLKMKLIK
ncbi:MAG: polysaccharide deacetylase family protein [Candidatus Delongbacteria bacterium]|jgi:peptidoglycan/xylan/chitin deacetylase (PgdA/CDA1 family)|nr:polysaccharide deacetylase family protein [Candidatus Delongbacteria bacterium]